MASFFTAKTYSFLQQLAVNNHKDWFNDHKGEYEAHVREPALAFIGEMQHWIKMLSPHYEAIPKKMGGSLMRVYRDTRFSKDKSPYKTNVGIQFRHEIGKDVHAPGFYVHLEPDNSFVGVGVWRPERHALKQIRDLIVTQPAAYTDAIEHLPFKQKYRLEGDSLVRPPRGFDPEHPLIEEIKRKDFIGLSPLSDSQLYSESLCEDVSRLFGRAQPWQRFLCDALQLRF